jgi:hypothetical protein
MTPLDCCDSVHNEFHDGVLWGFVSIYVHISLIVWISSHRSALVVCRVSGYERMEPLKMLGNAEARAHTKRREMNIYESTKKSPELMYLFNPPKTS